MDACGRIIKIISGLIESLFVNNVTIYVKGSETWES